MQELPLQASQNNGQTASSFNGVNTAYSSQMVSSTNQSFSGQHHLQKPQQQQGHSNQQYPQPQSQNHNQAYVHVVCQLHQQHHQQYQQQQQQQNRTGFFFAVKEVSLVEQGLGAKQCISQLEQEIALLSQFEHENIVQYLGTDQESEKLYIFLELVTQGSLQSLYQKYRLIDSQVRAYTGQILTGLKYLHDSNVMHRDIKCGNILVDAHGLIKLADFGLAKETSKLNELKSCKGSAYWMAPEVINPRKSYWLPADIWSLGCTVLEMLTRRPPNGDLEWHRALWKVGHGEIPPIPNALSSDAKDFIKRCLKIEAADRPSAAELLDHPFVKRSLSADVSTAVPPTKSRHQRPLAR